MEVRRLSLVPALIDRPVYTVCVSDVVHVARAHNVQG